MMRHWEWSGLRFYPPYQWGLNPHRNVNPVVWEPWKDIRTVKHQLIYICSPYTPRGADPCPESHQNVKKAIDAGIAALHKGWVPVIPHLYHHVHLEHPHPYETWMTVGSSLLEKCDALLVVEPQDLTSGMKREIDQATKQGTRILWGLGSL